MTVHPDRARFAALMEKLRVPPTGPDPDIEAAALEAMRLWGQILARDESGEDPLSTAEFHSLAEDLADLQRTARAAAGRPLPAPTRH